MCVQVDVCVCVSTEQESLGHFVFIFKCLILSSLWAVHERMSACMHMRLFVCVHMFVHMYL